MQSISNGRERCFHFASPGVCRFIHMHRALPAAEPFKIPVREFQGKVRALTRRRYLKFLVAIRVIELGTNEHFHQIFFPQTDTLAFDKWWIKDMKLFKRYLETNIQIPGAPEHFDFSFDTHADAFIG